MDLKDQQFQVEVFEGPLDLLLFLIRKSEIDLYDIPIQTLTRQYLDYLELMKMLDLDIAAEFLSMAATLMHLKSRLLLPPEEREEEEEKDPRWDLVRQLLEYKRFKEASGVLSSLEDESVKLFYRAGFHSDVHKVALEDQQVSLKNITMFNLIASFKKVLDNVPKKVYHDIELLNVTIDEQMSYIADVFRTKEEVTFFELVSHMSEKIRIIVTIIALLEMVKNKVIGIRPTAHDDDIIIYKMRTA